MSSSSYPIRETAPAQAPEIETAVLTLADASAFTALIARQQFTDFARESGRGAALIQFNRRVSRWANSIDPKYRKVAYAMGSLADGDTHQCYPGRKKILDRYAERHHEVISDRTLKRRQGEMRELGLLSWDADQERSEPHAEHPNAWRTNTYTVNFGISVNAGVAEPHDFIAELPDLPEKEAGPRGWPTVGPRVAHGWPTISSSDSSESSPSSSARDDVQASPLVPPPGDNTEYEYAPGEETAREWALELTDTFGTEVKPEPVIKLLATVLDQFPAAVIGITGEQWDDLAEKSRAKDNPPGYFMSRLEQVLRHNAAHPGWDEAEDEACSPAPAENTNLIERWDAAGFDPFRTCNSETATWHDRANNFSTCHCAWCESYRECYRIEREIARVARLANKLG
jgi:hypothetical protein